MRKERKNHTPAEKVKILRRHLLDQVSVSDLCEEYNLKPVVFYRWQKEFFENGELVFSQEGSREQRAANKKISALEEKLSKKNEVLSELMEEHVKLKKEYGEL